MGKQTSILKHTSTEEQNNIKNLKILGAFLQNILTKHLPEFICKTNEIQNFSSYNDNDYTFCWSEEDVPTEFLNRNFIKTLEPLCFIYHTKSSHNFYGGYNLGCSSLRWARKHKHIDDKVETNYCFIGFNLLPKDIISDYSEEEQMLIIYQDFERKFEQLIKPFLKTEPDVWRDELPSLSLGELVSLFRQFDEP